MFCYQDKNGLVCQNDFMFKFLSLLENKEANGKIILTIEATISILVLVVKDAIMQMTQFAITICRLNTLKDAPFSQESGFSLLPPKNQYQIYIADKSFQKD